MVLKENSASKLTGTLQLCGAFVSDRYSMGYSCGRNYVDDFSTRIAIQWMPSYQGWTDPMGIRAMPLGPPPKGAHQTS